MSAYGGHHADDDDFVHDRYSPPHSRRRDYSPDYHSGGYMTGAMPAPPPMVPAAAYDGQTPFYPPPNRRQQQVSNSLQVPQSSSRPRSTPPSSRRNDDGNYRRDSGKSRDRSRGRNREKDDFSDSDRERSRARSPLGKAKHVMKNTFSDSTSGLGVGVLGAIIGGMAAREASEAAGRSKSHGRHGSRDHQGVELLSTIVGAAVGGLGANALEKRIERSRGKTKGDQEKWEKKYGRDERDKDRRDGREGQVGREKVRDKDRERERDRDIDRIGRDMEEGRAGGGGGRESGERRRGVEYDESGSEPEYVYERRPRRRSDEERRYRS